GNKFEKYYFINYILKFYCFNFFAGGCEEFSKVRFLLVCSSAGCCMVNCCCCKFFSACICLLLDSKAAFFNTCSIVKPAFFQYFLTEFHNCPSCGSACVHRFTTSCCCSFVP